ncbi:MAG TPA: lysylphosphatidylglycerol synthase domain-containing protein, partial [Anaerolineales bacterium]|nr:lysylphosphatidylglycerol synthase domain-containing protein [Anaerolineales bacterium]
LLLAAFFPGAKLVWAAFSLGVAALGIAAPSSPGALGVMELAIVGALSLFGLNASTALAFAITAHLMQYLTTGVLGAYFLAKDGESLTGLYRRIKDRG